MTWYALLFLTALGGAACMDVSGGRIANGWILGSLCAAAACRIFSEGVFGILPALPGMLLPPVLFFPLFRRRMLGGGDIKLLSVCGAFLDLSVLPSFLLYTFCFGGLVSLFLIAGRGISPMERFSYLVSFLGQESRGERRPYRREGAFPENFCFSVPILLAGVYSVSAGLL